MFYVFPYFPVCSTNHRLLPGGKQVWTDVQGIWPPLNWIQLHPGRAGNTGRAGTALEGKVLTNNGLDCHVAIRGKQITLFTFVYPVVLCYFRQTENEFSIVFSCFLFVCMARKRWAGLWVPLFMWHDFVWICHICHVVAGFAWGDETPADYEQRLKERMLPVLAGWMGSSNDCMRVACPLAFQCFPARKTT